MSARVLLLLPVLAACVSCATGAGARAMVSLDALPASCPSGQALREAVALGSVTGGEETSALGSSKVSDANLARAVSLTLEHHDLLGGVDAPYRLDVQLVELAQPAHGFTMEVSAFVRYRLVDTADGALLFDDVIASSCTREYEDAWVGSERLRLASEGAVQANLTALLEALCVASLGASPAERAP